MRVKNVWDSLLYKIGALANSLYLCGRGTTVLFTKYSSFSAPLPCVLVKVHVIIISTSLVRTKSATRSIFCSVNMFFINLRCMGTCLRGQYIIYNGDDL